MENTKIKISTRKDLFEWIISHSNFSGYISDSDMFIQTLYDTSLSVYFEQNVDLQTFIQEVINKFANFNAKNEFQCIWSDDFGKRENLNSDEFLQMLVSDEEDFHNLAKELRELIA